jgi:hypothetical protein
VSEIARNLLARQAGLETTTLRLTGAAEDSADFGYLKDGSLAFPCN